VVSAGLVVVIVVSSFASAAAACIMWRWSEASNVGKGGVSCCSTGVDVAGDMTPTGFVIVVFQHSRGGVKGVRHGESTRRNLWGAVSEGCVFISMVAMIRSMRWDCTNPTETESMRWGMGIGSAVDNNGELTACQSEVVVLHHNAVS